MKTITSISKPCQEKSIAVPQRQSSFFKPLVQRKLIVNSPNDSYEQEADAVAEMVMQGGNLFFQPTSPSISAVQRKCEHCEEEEKTEKLQMKESSADSTGTTAPASVNDAVNSNGQSLDAATRNFMELRFGENFGDVQIHNDSLASQSSADINALAYTHSNHIVFGNGQYQPGTDAGKKLLAHELTHVVQQKSNGISMVQRMAACPAHLNDDEPVPSGWRSYPGPTRVFHCGFRTILENRAPTRDDPMNECVYDHSGVLVDDRHPYAGCKGTPDQYDSSAGPLDWFAHGTIDSGGVVRQGLPAFITSRVYDISTAIASGIQAVESGLNTIKGITDSIGRALVLVILSAKAICDPSNWTYHSTMPARTRRHLNVMGGLLSSISLNGNLDNLLRNLTKPLRDFDIADLLTEISADMNATMRSGGDPTTISAGEIGSMSVYQFVEWLHARSFIFYNRPPEQVAQELLQAQP